MNDPISIEERRQKKAAKEARAAAMGYVDAAGMLLNGGGARRSCLYNINRMLQNEPDLEGVFGWNELASNVWIWRRPPWEEGKFTPRPATDTDTYHVRCRVEKTGLTMTTALAQEGIMLSSRSIVRNPVREYLETLVWDGVPRVAGGTTSEGEIIHPWLIAYMGAAPLEIHRAFGMRWLISAVARAFVPGCKVDTMLILEGKQGKLKSTALRTVATLDGKAYFTDDVSDVQGKDCALQISGRLIVEIAELDAMSRAEVNAIKAWLSRQSDEFRPPYGRTVQAYPRSCVFAGTVNPHGSGYLTDATGARRFWPVLVERLDIESLRRDVPQLWAEAVSLYRSGIQWWLTDAEEELARATQFERYATDPWAETIDFFIKGRFDVTMGEILDHLAIPRAQQTAIVAKRIGAHLLTVGWTRSLVARGFSKLWGFKLTAG